MEVSAATIAKTKKAALELSEDMDSQDLPGGADIADDVLAGDGEEVTLLDDELNGGGGAGDQARKPDLAMRLKRAESHENHNTSNWTRPNSAALKYMGYNGVVFGLTPCGPLWLEMRKISTLELLSNQRLELLKHVSTSELDRCIKDTY
ncbi:hypothetical protein RJ639_039765 [Escallonia herrerae]|uniref:Uncharacterized protein n=1 Tax=Escallonia herrerae TaxID=1293975 RepID=A0AA88WKC2_9ASTE|nr:hypothetical protein RJ639_039765 [Escallonia herrerae]